MNRIAALGVISGLAAGCGLPLDEGNYNVDFTTVSDTCDAPRPPPTVWHMAEADGAWTLTNTRNDFAASGRELGDQMVFETTRDDTTTTGCRLLGDYRIELEPEGDTFFGDILISIRAECDGSMCSSAFICDGKKVD